MYCVVGIAIYYAQDYVLLKPKRVEREFKYSIRSPYKELNIPYDKNTNINILQFPQKTTLKGVVLYFHGNKNNIERYAGFVPNFTRNGYEVWMLEYPGFGKSSGSFTEDRVYEWSLIMYNLARKRFNTDSIIIYGKSLGTGVASQLASVRDCKSLVLETPYYSIPSLAGTYFWMYPLEQMMRFKLPTYEYLRKVSAPVTVFHGTDDHVIPYSNAVQLKDVLKPHDEFVTLQGGTHNSLNNFAQVQLKLDSIMQ